MLWLHLQPEEAPSLPDFSEQRRRALELPRLVAISATKALFPPYLHRLLNANLGLCWKLVISDCVTQQQLFRIYQDSFSQSWFAVSILNQFVMN